MFHFSCFLCSGDKTQTSWHSNPTLLTRPCNSPSSNTGEVTKTYIDPSLWRNLRLRWENLSALQTAYGCSKIRLLPCVRERSALLVSCMQRCRAAVCLEVGTNKAWTRGAEERKPLVQREHGSDGTANPLQPISARPGFTLTRMPKVHFYEPSCQSCKMSSAINEKKQ